MRLGLALLVSLAALQWQAIGAASPPVQADGERKLLLQYAGGLLSAEIENVPLGTVLAELERKTGIKAAFIERAAAGLPVWARFKDLPLERGAQRIMGDASCVYLDRGGTRVLYVLSSAATRQLPAHALDAAESFAGQAAESAHFGDEESAASTTQQAIAQLTASVGDEQLLAVNQLTGMRDEHAVAALSNAASSAAAAIDVRVSAVAALAQNALSSPAEETPSLAALRQLSNDGEPHVRDAARQTLQDIEQQRREIARANAKRRDSSGG